MHGDARSTVVVIEDDEDLASLLEALLQGRPDLRLVAPPGPLDAGLTAVEEHRPDVVIVGDHGDAADLRSVLARVRRRVPHAKVVVLSRLADPYTLLSALEDGADAVLDDASLWRELLPVVRELLRTAPVASSAAGSRSGSAAPDLVALGTLRGTIESDGAVVRIRLAGDLDAANAAELGDQLVAACSRPFPLAVEVDATALEFLDSGGLFALVHLLRHVRRGGGDVVVRGSTRSVRRILDLSGFSTLAGATVV
jgi:anti-anti-sigma factor